VEAETCRSKGDEVLARRYTSAYPEKREADPEEMTSVAVHEEVLEEEAAVKTGRALKKRYRDQHLPRCGIVT
jgi:hypothetical protein